MKKIDFTVLIPVYNTDPAHLYEAVRSVLKQTIDQKYKIVIVDDGSTQTSTIVAINALRSSDIVIRRLDENGGTSAALNHGHEAIDSEYIALMGSDDVSHPDRFKHQVNFLSLHPDVDVLGTDLFSFRDGDIFRKRTFMSDHPERPTLKNTKGGWLVNHGTVMYKNKAVKDVGGYDPKFKRGQDVELWKRMAAKEKQFANLKPLLYGWRRK
jgi:glycosyltransferase involved in cell wall biosynthesis